MLWNLILGAVAGYLTPKAEPHVKRVLENLAQAEMPVGKTEYDMLSLLILLLAAATLVALIGADSSAFLLLIGALGGLFGKTFYAAVVNRDGSAPVARPDSTASEAPPATDEPAGTEGETARPEKGDS